MTERRVAVLGATGLLGECLVSALADAGWKVLALSRRTPAAQPASLASADLPFWICAAPIWALPEQFRQLEAHGARRVVALSSTSRFTKNASPDREERIVAQRLREGEERLCAWARPLGIEWVILRPTLIYGRGRDRNISEIARFIRRFGFFPLFGKAAGLRQPVHVEDVASACIAALDSSAAANLAYELSGGEILSYRDMVRRVFTALGRRPQLVPLPLWIFRIGLLAARLLPSCRHWSSAMAERMNRDLVFDHSAATRILGFAPRPFALSAADVGA